VGRISLGGGVMRNWMEAMETKKYLVYKLMTYSTKIGAAVLFLNDVIEREPDKALCTIVQLRRLVRNTSELIDKLDGR
jgi:hypothetical protein